MNARDVLDRGADEEVVCIACGASLPRSEAREYDKHGDRWTREGKTFEYRCKPCHRAACHQPREGLERTLEAAGAGQTDRDSFLEQYCELVAEEVGDGD
jgi:hypothetical protein